MKTCLFLFLDLKSDAPPPDYPSTSLAILWNYPQMVVRVPFCVKLYGAEATRIANRLRECESPNRDKGHDKSVRYAYPRKE